MALSNLATQWAHCMTSDWLTFSVNMFPSQLLCIFSAILPKMITWLKLKFVGHCLHIKTIRDDDEVKPPNVCWLLLSEWNQIPYRSYIGRTCVKLLCAESLFASVCVVCDTPKFFSPFSGKTANGVATDDLLVHGTTLNHQQQIISLVVNTAVPV